MSRNILALMVAGSAMITGCASLHAEEDNDETINLTQAPAAVQAAVQKALGGAKLDSLSKEDENGKTIFEAEYKVGDSAHSVKIAESGEVLESEATIAEKDLPAAVTDAIKKKYPGATIAKAEEVQADNKKHYEVDIKSGNEKQEVSIDASGTITADDKEEEHEDKDNDKDEKEEHGNHEKEEK